MPSCAEMYCSLSSITSRALILSFRESEMQNVVPIGDSSYVGLARSTNPILGKTVMVFPPCDRIVADDLQLVIIKNESNLSK